MALSEKPLGALGENFRTRQSHDLPLLRGVALPGRGGRSMSQWEEDASLVCSKCGVTFDCHEVLSPDCDGEPEDSADAGEGKEGR